MEWRQVYRYDSLLYTTLGGAGIAAAVMCLDSHTFSHGGWYPTLPLAAGLGAVTALPVGCIGRLVGALLLSRRGADAAIR